MAVRGSRVMVAVRLGVATAALAAAAVIACPGAAPAMAGGSEPFLVWSRWDAAGDTARIVRADTQGRQVRVLTHPPAGAVDVDPQVSPDGRLVLFERDDVNGARIGLVGIDGRGERLLDLGCVDPCVADLMPNWTRDSRHLTWTPVLGPFDPETEDAASAVLWTADLDGRHKRRLSTPGIDGIYEEYGAQYAPGGYLILSRFRNADKHLTTIRRDPNAHERQLTRWELDADLPDVSPATHGPTKDLVVFETYGGTGLGKPPGIAQAIATVPATCRNLTDCAAKTRYLTKADTLPVENYNPAWSPDGRRIAFVRAQPGSSDIWTMRWDGTRSRAFTGPPLIDFRPEWGTKHQQHR